MTHPFLTPFIMSLQVSLGSIQPMLKSSPSVWPSGGFRPIIKYEAMFEKYDVNGDGKPGGGGEYEDQVGFRWTNGAALQLLNQYGDRLSPGGSGLSASVLTALVYSILKSVC
ncbi:hypothetical protein cypCar_00035931 [Cyprinus carpio]|nr:hypothetical protein cypCar_00035931 [Cyprinus carpio]